MIRRWLLMVVIVVLLLVAGCEPTPTPPPTPLPQPLPTAVLEGAPWQVYLPRVVNLPPASWLSRGVAWYAPATFREANLLKAWWVYHSSGCRRHGGRVLPIVRTAYWAQCFEHLPGDYDGRLFVGNEGEFLGQDGLTPVQMAAFVERVRLHWPRAKLICLNSYLISYMAQVMQEMERPCDAWGLHVYIQADWLPSQRVDAVCAAVAERWGEAEPCQVVVSEMGYLADAPEARQVMRVWTEDAIADERILFVLGYTATEANLEAGNMVDSEGRLRPNGQGFVDGSKR